MANYYLGNSFSFCMKAFFFFLFLSVSSVFTAGEVIEQPAKYSLSNGHAHNDYLNQRPFYEAYENGFGSIEADVFPVNGKLCVAHSKREIDTTRTLDLLYLQPITRETEKGNARHFQLLV